MNIREWQKAREKCDKRPKTYQCLPVTTSVHIKDLRGKIFFSEGEERKIPPTGKKIENTGNHWELVSDSDDLPTFSARLQDGSTWICNREEDLRFADLWDPDRSSSFELSFQRSQSDFRVTPADAPPYSCHFIGSRVSFHRFPDDREIFGHVVEQKYLGRFNPGDIPEYLLTVRDAAGNFHEAQVVRDYVRILDGAN